MKITCACQYHFEAEPTPESGWSVKCPQCGATLRVQPSGVSKKAFKEGVKAAKIGTQRTPPDGEWAIASRARKIETVSSVLWAVIGIIQIILVYTAAAGIWNVINAVIRLRSSRNIRAGNENVPAYFDERKTWLIVLAVVNLVLGGVVGVFLVAVDWHNRDYVLRNRAAFEINSATKI